MFATSRTRGFLRAITARRFLSTPALPAPPVAEGAQIAAGGGGGGGGGGFFATLLAASLGAAAGAGFSYVALEFQQENMVERVEMQRALAALRTESATALVDYRSRVALLEHEVAGLKRDIAAWGRGQ